MLGRQILFGGSVVRRKATTVWTVTKGIILIVGGLSIQTDAEVGATSFATVLENHSSEDRTMSVSSSCLAQEGTC